MTFRYKLEDISSAAKWLLERLGEKRLVVLKGEMGAGKTTLVKAIAGEMGADENEVNSPTFSIVNEYETERGLVYHFDFYRIKKQSEAVDFGIFDYFDSGRYCFMEWAELIPDLLPDDVVTVEIRETGEGEREISI